MSENNKWYVYMHTNKINNKKYIGITGQQKYWTRWGTNGNGYKTQMFGKAIKKYGWENFNHEILGTVTTQDQAFELERFYIQKYQTNDNKFGYNVTAGGETTYGVYNLPSMSVPVCQYDLEGNFIAEFPSIKEAERVTGIDNSLISACCRGVNHYTKTYIWSYEKHSKIPGINPKQLRYDLVTKKQEKKVYQYNLDGTFIKSYKSVSEANRLTGVDFRDISACCLRANKKQAGGFIWSYEYQESVDPYDSYYGKKIIYQYDLDGNLLGTYNGYKPVLSECDISQNALYKACRNTENRNYKTCKGYIWSYHELNDRTYFDMIRAKIEHKN